MKFANLKQLRIVDALIECRTTKQAASKLNVSPAMINYTLRQLREHYSDPLFIRRAGLNPTALALQLQKEYKELQGLNTTKKELMISTHSVIEIILANYMQGLPEGEGDTLLRFNISDYTPEDRLKNLRNRTVDIDIGSKLPDDASIITTRLMQSDVCVMARQNHSFITDQVSVHEWMKCGHLRWYPDNDNFYTLGEGTDLTAPIFTKRNIRYESVNLLAMAYFCSRSDFIMLIPKTFVGPLNRYYNLKAVQPPEGVSLKFDCYMQYHRTMKEYIKTLSLADAFAELQNS